MNIIAWETSSFSEFIIKSAQLLTSITAIIFEVHMNEPKAIAERQK